MDESLGQPGAVLPERIRAFVAVRIPDEVLSQLGAIQQQLKRKFPEVSWTRAEAMHVTLRFLGNIESARLPELDGALRGATGGFSAFDLELSGIGSFGNRVLWAGIKRGAEPLTLLANSLRPAASTFSAHEEERPFNAHVTLGRFRRPERGVARILAELKAPQFGSWRVDHFELIRSELSPQGARYTALAEFPLQQGDAET
jgi:RNA 2',3'-cyclic 3'-phosphodiesterase